MTYKLKCQRSDLTLVLGDYEGLPASMCRICDQNLQKIKELVLSAYVIFNYKILDRRKIDQLTELVKPIDEKYEAEVIVGSPVKTIEGSTFPNMVIYKSKNFAAASQWFYSKEHQEVSIFRNAVTEGWATIVPGISETDDLIQSGYFECKDT